MKNAMRERLVIVLMAAVMASLAMPAVADQYNRQGDYQRLHYGHYGHYGHQGYYGHHRYGSRYQRNGRGYNRHRAFGYAHGYYSRGYSPPPVMFAPSPPPPPVVPWLNIVIPFRIP